MSPISKTKALSKISGPPGKLHFPGVAARIVANFQLGLPLLGNLLDLDLKDPLQSLIAIGHEYGISPNVNTIVETLLSDPNQSTDFCCGTWRFQRDHDLQPTAPRRAM